MAGGWLIQRGGQEIGPMSSEVLKQLAATGQLRPTDRVRKTMMDHFVPASAVKGLFPSDSGPGAPVVAAEARPAPHDEKKPESQPPRTPVTAKPFPVFWARLGFIPRAALGGAGTLVLLIFLTLALGHHGDQDPEAGVVADGPAESAPPRRAHPRRSPARHRGPAARLPDQQAAVRRIPATRSKTLTRSWPT